MPVSGYQALICYKALWRWVFFAGVGMHIKQ
jgi:hypothetical protein